MQKRNYLPRLIDTTVTDYLSAFGAVVIEGPKWCGKTWTSAQHCNSEFFLAACRSEIFGLGKSMSIPIGA